MRRSIPLLLAGALGAAGTVHAATVTDIFLWQGATVRISHPDAVHFDGLFDVVFELDGTSLPPAETVAFFSAVRLSDTVVLDAASWRYDFYTADPSATPHVQLDQARLTTPYTAPTAGDPFNSWSLVDPLTEGSLFGDGATFLWGCCQDRAVWTLANLRMRELTRFELTLSDENLVASPPFAAAAIALAPAAPVPEPAGWAQLAAGLAFVGLAWRRRACRQAAAARPR